MDRPSIVLVSGSVRSVNPGTAGRINDKFCTRLYPRIIDMVLNGTRVQCTRVRYLGRYKSKCYKNGIVNTRFSL
jgi:hypothetical protein